MQPYAGFPHELSIDPYDAVFFYDPDQIKLEIVHRPPRPGLAQPQG